MANIFGLDALTTLALAGARTTRIELGTFVVPTFPRHPFAMAQQALTVQGACGNRLALGIGLSHLVTMQDRLGFDWDHPIRHMREYLSVLNPLLAQEPATFEGQEFRVSGAQLGVPGSAAPPVLVRVYSRARGPGHHGYRAAGGPPGPAHRRVITGLRHHQRR